MVQYFLRLSAVLCICTVVIACSGSSPTSPTGTMTPAPGPGSGQPSTMTPAPAQSGAPAGGNLRYQAPAAWKSEPPSSGMRFAQFVLPKADGDAEDAALVIFYFGQGQGGGVQANLDRWVGQMQQPDGNSSQAKAKTETAKINGLNATLLDVTGTYTAEMTPGAGDRQNKTNYRLRGAVVETPKGAYFVKLTGPQKTIQRWESEFTAFINSFEFK